MEPKTAKAVAAQLMAKDALHAHAMDELGIREFTKVGNLAYPFPLLYLMSNMYFLYVLFF